MVRRRRYDIIVIGGGHAGAEAAWAASNLLRARGGGGGRGEGDGDGGGGGRVGLITMDRRKIGAMSCNPAIGGLAKGQMVREIDALGGLMGLAIDATGIQFRVLNANKGPAVQGPRAQADKYEYAAEVQRLLGTRDNLDILSGTVDRMIVEGGAIQGVVYRYCPAPEILPPDTGSSGLLSLRRSHASPCARPVSGVFEDDCCGEFGDMGLADKPIRLDAGAVVLTTGTFMRGLMHTGPQQVEGGRIGEGSAESISGALRDLGFELGRLKTGTPPRLAAETIDFSVLDVQAGDDDPQPFSDMTARKNLSGIHGGLTGINDGAYARVCGGRFPVIEQRLCYITHTSVAIHDRIRANLDRAPMYNGQIETAGPRYCPSIEDKVMRFSDRSAHHVFLEPESLTTNEIYCNGISTSLPRDVQNYVVENLPGCGDAKILKYGYAVEYDMVWPHQIDATCMTKLVRGLFLAGQINGTSGYEEAAGQGLMAGLNAVRLIQGEDPVRLRRDQAYIGVMLDDLVTKTPREPYRMFTSRAEHRLVLRSDNAAVRLTPIGRMWGLVDDERWGRYESDQAEERGLREQLGLIRLEGKTLLAHLPRPEVDEGWVRERLTGGNGVHQVSRRVLQRVLSEGQYAGYLKRQASEIEKLGRSEGHIVPASFDYGKVSGLRNESRMALEKFRPATLGQASRLSGITPADIMLLRVVLSR